VQEVSSAGYTIVFIIFQFFSTKTACKTLGQTSSEMTLKEKGSAYISFFISSTERKKA
jgi:hypothetical protein